MFAEHAGWILTIWAVTFGIGLISLPLARRLFPFSTDKGYAYAKMLGWFAISYLTLLFATIRIAPLPLPAIIAALAVWSGANLYFCLRGHGLRDIFRFLPRGESRVPLRSILIAEVLFLAGISAVVAVKGFNPEVYQIERFMDFGFVEVLRNSTTLPAADMWFAGETINYYYGGHIISFVMLTLAGIPSVPGFFLSVGFIVALLAGAIWRFGVDLAVRLAPRARKITLALAGLVSVFVALISGPWYMIPWIFYKLGFPLGIGTPESFFYPEPTRVMPGTITEMPVFSFLVADTHAHVWGMLSGVLILALTFALWRDDRAKLDVKNRYLWALAAVLGMAYIVNSWDAVTLGTLSVIMIAVRYWKEKKLRIAAAAALLAAAAYAMALPWSLFNHIPVDGVGLVKAQSPLWPWISFWGSIVLVALLYYIRRYYSSKKLFEHVPRSRYVEAVFAAGILFLAAIELVYMKDILLEGEWFRANTVFKVTTQVWIWFGALAGPIFVWLFASLKKAWVRATALVLLCVYAAIGAVYPVIAARQAFVENRTFVGISQGLGWWKQRYPDDYAAYEYLKSVRDALPQSERMKHIVEAEGDSYTDVSMFSVFLGWPTIVGWPVHEWTWRGGYGPVGDRRTEVREIYAGIDVQKAMTILEKYAVDYIILGQIERQKYPDINEDKVRLLGEAVFEQNGTLVIKVRRSDNPAALPELRGGRHEIEQPSQPAEEPRG